MDSTPSSDEVIFDFPFVFRIYKGGRAERYLQSPFVPPANADGDDAGTCRSKDVEISPEGENRVSARIFLPKAVSKGEKLPVLIYIHGGAFVIGSAFSSVYHSFVSSVVEQANVLAVSIQYRLAPEHPIPACFEDCWETIKWVTSHANNGLRRRPDPEPWITDYADFTRIFVAGDSAGGTITQNMMARAAGCIDGVEDGVVKIVGMILIHPYFGSGQSEKLWEVLCSDQTSPEDPRMNPMAHPNLLRGLKCNKVLIFTAEKDFLRDRGWLYHEALKNSGWDGQVEIVESRGEDHVFHLKNPNCENANFLMKKMVSFLQD